MSSPVKDKVLLEEIKLKNTQAQIEKIKLQIELKNLELQQPKPRLGLGLEVGVITGKLIFTKILKLDLPVVWIWIPI